MAVAVVVVLLALGGQDMLPWWLIALLLTWTLIDFVTRDARCGGARR